jgi:hypothetical protein
MFMIYRLALAVKPLSAVKPACASTTHCAGVGHAEPGYMCIYSSEQLGGGKFNSVTNNESIGEKPGTGRFGAVLEWVTEAPPSELFDFGSYTITAP